MSELSRTVLMHCFDYAEIAERRRRNYAILSEMLGRLAIFRDLPAEVVPLGFPMRAKDRGHLQQTLFDHGIYPAVHWPLEGVVSAELEASHRLAADILTLPCDQRYGCADMDRIAGLVLEALES